MNIFTALRESHDIQRELCAKVTNTQGESSERDSLFQQLVRELKAHARAEERFFYLPLMEYDQGVDLSRHAIAEHHEMDELIEQLQATEYSSPTWLVYAKQLSDLVVHHLKEEEHRFFQMAGKLLSEEEKVQLVKGYNQDYQNGLQEF
ncbi:hemerythrin [Thiopseudomonas alkaliphila]|uniref:hemerythrin domain-containing protein n=1 Tax=Thiopseudomonas alkaliphila TaxID=1697053 RepID=UPI00069E390C|nr:hemerythrin domain-containing protein [Thiopseudomonas alkaliphila]AKX43869.1 hemerythrin [Thiopseudomonas alkaliphila]AKX46148.1 hemerythrin [Thiopseudomonas alkaliphila]AKX49224.1 hemerythrin [Thiopseudomonas alkaliphila]AKX51916.1 hemerythrin [Thiopseudomonas alkaliphila]AKX52869.1 hemerythrin [Thiopseudomonas alkaliphila]